MKAPLAGMCSRPTISIRNHNRHTPWTMARDTSKPIRALRLEVASSRLFWARGDGSVLEAGVTNLIIIATATDERWVSV